MVLVAMPWRICLLEVGMLAECAGFGAAVCAAWCRVACDGSCCLPDGTEFAEKVEELFGADGVAEVLDKERSGGSSAGGFGRDLGRDGPLTYSLRVRGESSCS